MALIQPFARHSGARALAREPERLGVVLGAGLGFRLSPAWRAMFNYDAEIRGSDVAHLLSAGLKGNW